MTAARTCSCANNAPKPLSAAAATSGIDVCLLPRQSRRGIRGRPRGHRRMAPRWAVALVAASFLCSGEAFAPTRTGHVRSLSSAAHKIFASLGMTASSDGLRRIGTSGGEGRQSQRVTCGGGAAAAAHGHPRVPSPALPPPPTREEETALLGLAVEYRRIRSMERDLALRSPAGKSLSLLSVRAAKCGYGEDVHLYEAAVEEGQTAREELIQRNMGLVRHVVNNIVGSRKLHSLSREDLVQEGALGLARAVDRYDPDAANGGRFGTYAVHWVRAAVLRCIAERDEVIRVPEHISTAVRKLRRLGLELPVDGDPWREFKDAKNLAIKATGLSETQLQEALRVDARRRLGGHLSFEAWMQGDAAGSVEAMSSSGLAVGTVGGGAVEDTEHLREVLSRFLRPKEVEALSWRYGLLSRTNEAEQSGSFIDYEAEAEADLFGPGGILASAPPATAPKTNSSGMTRQSRAGKLSQSRPIRSGGRWGEAMSFAEVGKQMAISAEYGRRLCSAALKKLQKAAEEGRLPEAELLF